MVLIFYLNNNLNENDLKKNENFLDENILENIIDENEIDKIITTPIIEEKEFFNQKLSDDIIGNDFKEVINSNPRKWLMKNISRLNKPRQIMTLENALKLYDEESIKRGKKSIKNSRKGKLFLHKTQRLENEKNIKKNIEGNKLRNIPKPISRNLNKEIIKNNDNFKKKDSNNSACGYKKKVSLCHDCKTLLKKQSNKIEKNEFTAENIEENQNNKNRY